MIKNSLLVGCLGLAVAGCSSLEQHSAGLLRKSDTRYVTAQTGAGLNVPPGLSSVNVGEDYPIPPVNSTGPIPAPTAPPGGVSVKNTAGSQAHKGQNASKISTFNIPKQIVQ